MTNVHKENVIVTLEERTMHLKLIRQKAFWAVYQDDAKNQPFF